MEKKRLFKSVYEDKMCLRTAEVAGNDIGCRRTAQVAGDERRWPETSAGGRRRAQVAGDEDGNRQEEGSSQGLQREREMGLNVFLSNYSFAYQPLEKNSLSDIEKRKKEVEEKLQILNARKHNLVQVLKQILSAEEELRRRSNVQGSTGRPLMSLQVDVGNDNGSISRRVTPRPVSEGNCNGDTEGADADDGPNQNLRSRSLPRMTSVSPTPDTLHRRAPFSMVSNPSRTTSGVVASSPSRFAPSGQQTNPTVSVTGTSYVPTSPSPAAASGGSLAFRDARLPSPWT
ncbi:hypothetical protein OSB04_004158 [Centaurea solstitialis]|uniref:Uncharacterized protein n=1 Tax=Centaurea solstitialis TaxID=347529 RepID=A0AA38WPI8_9ASTR|nr:hypothetical protein OSB04_004158 [Centaurea solstitialis]